MRQLPTSSLDPFSKSVTHPAHSYQCTWKFPSLAPPSPTSVLPSILPSLLPSFIPLSRLSFPPTQTVVHLLFHLSTHHRALNNISFDVVSLKHQSDTTETESSFRSVGLWENWFCCTSFGHNFKNVSVTLSEDLLEIPPFL